MEEIFPNFDHTQDFTDDYLPPRKKRPALKVLQAESSSSRGIIPEKREKSEWKPSAGKIQKLEKRITYTKLCVEICATKLETIHWLIDVGLIASQVYCTHPTCSLPMTLTETDTTNDGYVWMCRATVKGEAKRHQKKKTIRANSWFSKSRLTLREIILMTYMWCHQYSQKQTEQELGISLNSLVDWHNFCREVCEEEVIRNSEQIGGEGVLTQIDESKFGKRKFNRGRMVEGQWVFGGREDLDRTKIFMEIVQKRDTATLLPIIKKWIKPGSIIQSDFWKAYDCLDKEGYIHQKVNHSIEFKNPLDGTCTNAIEGEWRQAKASLPKFGTSKSMLGSYLGAFLWRVKHSKEDIFFAFIQTVKKVYNPEEWKSPSERSTPE